jgi:hypothetical protein
MLIVTGLLIATICLPIGTLTDASGSIYAFKPIGIFLTEGRSSTWGLFCILLLSAIVEALTILLYKVRVLQLRMTIFSSLLMLGYYLALGAFFIVLSNDYTYSPTIGIILPLVSIVLNYLAIRGILRDEAIVHAADRLR